MELLNFFRKSSGTTKFSIIAFIVTLALGFLSMGVLGLLLYYPVSFLFNAYPNPDEMHGDWVWPAMIGTGMFWSIGFILAGLLNHYIKKFLISKWPLRLIYIFVLWMWAAFIWYVTLAANVKNI